MSFVHLGGEAGARPTYFEVYAADKLVPSLKSAVIYALAVFGQRHAWVQRLLQYEDEVFAAVSLLLDRNSLMHLDATFAESLYGLKRQPYSRPCPTHSTSGGAATAASAAPFSSQGSRSASTPAAAAAAAATPPGQPGGSFLGAFVEQPSPGRLSQRARWAAVGAEVLLPYLKVKADKLYQAHAPRSVVGLALARGLHQQHQQQQQAAGTGPLAARLQQLLLRGFLLAYPYVHAAVEAAKFAYQLLYLLEVAEVHHPVLQLLGQRVVRVSGADMALLDKDKMRRRQQQLTAASQQPSLLRRWLGLGWFYSTTAVSDHLRTVIIASVFGYKVLEWWFTSAEERLSANKALPPPPPPAAPHPHPAGVPLSPDVRLCPLCRRPRTNPALLAVSGYAFCYPCIFSYVTEHHSCPVTLAYASLDHVRKLYEAM